MSSFFLFIPNSSASDGSPSTEYNVCCLRRDLQLQQRTSKRWALSYLWSMKAYHTVRDRADRISSTVQPVLVSYWPQSLVNVLLSSHPNCYAIECLEKISVNEREMSYWMPRKDQCQWEGDDNWDLIFIVQELGQAHNWTYKAHPFDFSTVVL